MGSRLLVRLPATRHRDREGGTILTAAGIVAALVLTLTGAAMVQLSAANLRGAFASSDIGQARGAAAEGVGLMISNWNQPRNRRLLVSGQDPASWSTADLVSPCSPLLAPDQAAIDLADGAWRDVVTGAVAGANTDGRQYRLVGITYTAGTLSRTASPGEGSTGDPIPAGGWSSLINLRDPDNDPDTISPARGDNSGSLVLTVDGRVVRDGREVANSRLSQEFEVLPKCCNRSLGSGGAESLGSDRRDPYPPGCPSAPSGSPLEDWVARDTTSSRLW